MERSQEVLRYIRTGTHGIEVAPWFSPIVPRGGERSVLVLDVFDRPTLMARAEIDPLIDNATIPGISEVDLVGSACEIAELTRARCGPDVHLDFVVSSHNFEHLPDPIRFLRGCETLLAAGGMVSMAVPDKRACFDFFRPHSSTADMLQAFHERRDRPTFAQSFSHAAYTATLRLRRSETTGFSIYNDTSKVALVGNIVQAYSHWLGRIDANDTAYSDAHCWTFTPSSLELILTELTLLGLINFDIVSVTEPMGCEFFVHLRKRPEDAPPRTGLVERREVLLQQTIDELAYTSRYAWRLGVGGVTRRLGLLRRRLRGRIYRQFGI
jgi:hypothetical protein